MGFQKQVNRQQAPAVAGDFATSNPRSTVPSPEGGFVAGTGGINVATFAWVQTDGKTLLNSAESGVPDGFVHREQQAVIVTYLAESGNNIPAGFGVTLHNSGDFFFKANGAAAARGQKVFAKLSDGTTRAADAGATVSGYIETPWYVTRACGSGELGVMSRTL